MGQNLGLSVEAVTQHSQRLFSKSEELDQALKDVLQKLESLMENGVTYKDKQSSKDFYEQINVFSTSCTKYVEGVQKFASFLVDETITTYETSDQEILELQSKLDESLSALELASKIGDGNVTSSQLDFSKISATAGSAALGSFIAEDKVHKEYWEGELQLVPREDGTIQIVKDGTVMGYTTEEGVDLPDNTSPATASTPDYTDSVRFNAAMSSGSSSTSDTTGGGQTVVPTEANQGGIEIPTNLGDYAAVQNGTATSQEKVNIPTNLGDYAAAQNGTSTNPEIDIPTSFKEFATEYNTAATTQSTTLGVADTSTTSNSFAFDTSTATTSESPSSGTMDTSTASNSFASDTSSATTSQSASSGSANTSATSNSFASDTNTTTTSQSSSSEPIDIPTSFNEFMNGQTTGSSQTTSQSTGTELPNIQDFINK
jgi:PREDICTED: hypothetical protein